MLATVGKIVEITPIPGADFIQAARVVCGKAGAWSGVIAKGIEIGELVTVFLQDALLPPHDRWAFMEKHKWRVRMAKFKGVPSECLIVRGAPPMPVGTDLSQELGVTKYEKPVPLGMQGDAVGAFPSFIPKTDEPNFQTVPELVELMKTQAWYAAEKADGTSCTAWFDHAGLHVCSRNWELKEFTASGSSNVYWATARKYGLDRLPLGLALQFEVVGPGIQGNPMGLKQVEARAFSLYDFSMRLDENGMFEKTNKFLSLARLEDIAHKLEIPLAKIIYSSYDIDKPCVYSDDWLRNLAEIKYENGKLGEGIVIRAMDSSWSFKVLSLLYGG